MISKKSAESNFYNILNVLIYKFHPNLNDRIINESSILHRCFWRPLLNVYRHFDSQIPVAFECLTLQLSHKNTSKCWWLPTSWPNYVRSQNTWNNIVIAVITWNVASKQYCLLQILVAALLLVSCAAFVMRYPDPQDRTKYFLRIDNSFYNLTCPNSLVFDQYIQQCTLNKNTTLYIQGLLENNCNQNMEGYYCTSSTSFIYCTYDGLIIVSTTCSGGQCLGYPNNKPCFPL
jgi:hypothetical protein